MQRRTLMGIGGFGGLALAGGSLLAATGRAHADDSPQNVGFVNVKDPQFGARGDGSDDTAAIQAAVNSCFGSPAAPHGSAAVSKNGVLYFPPGIYRITAPIELTKLHGCRILGSGRTTTRIVNETHGGVFATNGCGYSHFEGLCLISSDNNNAVFDLNWDGTPGGAALQSNTFIDMFFDGGAYGVDIGAGGFMGSENIFVNCFWYRSAMAGLKTSNFNACQNTVVGGNLQACNMGIWVSRGSVTMIESVGFQLQKEWDIRVDNSANDTINVIGCRTESPNFMQIKNYVHAVVLGCTHAASADPSTFLQPGRCPTTVERCVSIDGQIDLDAEARLTVRGCSFGRKDWLSYGTLYPNQVIELEDIQYGGTPNSHPNGVPLQIAKQRITSEGTFDYMVKRA
ncbi:MAG TPA: glycosyl hydrolase family 28-related protein [Xanthobacteraceae bacterium]